LLCARDRGLATLGIMSPDPRFDWRPIDVGQVRAWARLVAAIEAVDQQDEHEAEEDLLEEFGDPDIDYARGSIAVYDGAQMVGWSLLSSRTAADPVHDMRLGGGVHPRYRGLGIGSAILGWAEQAARPLHTDRFPGRPLALSGRCLARNEGAVEMFAAHGFQQSRRFLRMCADLTAGLPDLVAPAGVQIVGFTSERSADARLVHDEAFRDHWGSTDSSPENWAHFLGFDAFRTEYSFLAYEGAEPLGLVIGHEYDSYTKATGRLDLYIPTVGTRRHARGRGIASALLANALHAARSRGFVGATLDVDSDSPTGAVGLYQRAGFVVRDTWLTQTKPLPA
jgi:GNAT superfamily N-acetyltransferase